MIKWPQGRWRQPWGGWWRGRRLGWASRGSGSGGRDHCHQFQPCPCQRLPYKRLPSQHHRSLDSQLFLIFLLLIYFSLSILGCIEVLWKYQYYVGVSQMKITPFFLAWFFDIDFDLEWLWWLFETLYSYQFQGVGFDLLFSAVFHF